MSGASVSNSDVQFIDFEYGCFSYRGFDWGNHFNEYAGFECDYSRYPDTAGASLFLRHYLAESLGREPVRTTPCTMCFICYLDMMEWIHRVLHD